MRVALKELLVNEQVNDKPKWVRCGPIPINKVGDYYKGEDENTTLPMEFNKVKSLTILDIRDRVAKKPRRYGKLGVNWLLGKQG